MVCFSTHLKGKIKKHANQSCFSNLRGGYLDFDKVVYHCARGLDPEIEKWFLSEITSLFDLKYRKTKDKIHFTLNGSYSTRLLAILTACRYLDRNEDDEYGEGFSILTQAFKYKDKTDFITALFLAHWKTPRQYGFGHLLACGNNPLYLNRAVYLKYLPDSIGNIKTKKSESYESVHSFWGGVAVKGEEIQNVAKIIDTDFDAALEMVKTLRNNLTLNQK